MGSWVGFIWILLLLARFRNGRRENKGTKHSKYQRKVKLSTFQIEVKSDLVSPTLPVYKK